MTSQAIEGTGMTLTMSSGWTSDITEMQLPYSVRQAIDDTHLGDTIVRWVPSKKIEHGTMAIRFWHDPANQLPITGDPEMMVITYPDGVNHLTVVGFVEKIGKEVMQVDGLMQTDALVRVIDYPKAAAVPNGSFPMWTGELNGKVVTDIIDTATLRYLVDTTPSSPTDITTIKSTIPGVSADLPRTGGAGYVRTMGGKVFGRQGFFVPDEDAGVAYSSTLYPAGKTITDFTMACVLRLGPAKGSAFSYDVFRIGPVTSSLLLCGMLTGHSLSGNIEHFTIYISGQSIYSAYPLDGATTTEKGYIALCRRSGGSTRVIVNNVEKTATHRTVTPTLYDMRFACGDIDLSEFNHGIRDFAFWDTALSDSDFSTLNSQLCTEYGIT